MTVLRPASLAWLATAVVAGVGVVVPAALASAQPSGAAGTLWVVSADSDPTVGESDGGGAVTWDPRGEFSSGGVLQLDGSGLLPISEWW